MTFLYRDPETFHDNLFFTIATVPIVKIHVYYKKRNTFINIVKFLWKPTYFVMLIIGDMSSSDQSTIMTLEQAKKNDDNGHQNI